MSGNEVAATRTRLLSVIMPAMNEEKNLGRAFDELNAVMTKLPAWDLEVIVIDNDSTDGTGAVAASLCAKDARWRYLKFSRNFTVEISITAGLRYCKGDAAIILFSDLQDPPDAIPDFIARFDEGNDVVFGIVRERGGEPFWKSISARVLYVLIQRLSDVEITPNATDFRLLSRRAIDALNQFDERNRYMRGFAHWIGFRHCGITYDRRPRTEGKSKAPFFYLLNLAANAITCFSIRPLQFFSLAGMVALGLTVLLALVYLASYVFLFTVPGLTTVYLLLLANLAVLLLGFGALGEYVGRIYVETKRRPLFIVDRAINLQVTAPVASVERK